jgi:hypothetical protein
LQPVNFSFLLLKQHYFKYFKKIKINPGNPVNTQNPVQAKIKIPIHIREGSPASSNVVKKGHLLSLDHNFKSSVIRSKISPSYLKKEKKKKREEKPLLTGKENIHRLLPLQLPAVCCLSPASAREHQEKSSQRQDSVHLPSPLFYTASNKTIPHSF